MMNIVESIEMLKKSVNEGQREEVSKCIEIIKNTFRNMIFATGSKVAGDAEINVNFAEAKKAISNLRTIGADYGIEFPEIETDKQISAYILKMGIEVLKG